jgi:hypothetical protein
MISSGQDLVLGRETKAYTTEAAEGQRKRAAASALRRCV